ncbi:MAG: sugar phosphate isomerase/epimerase [Planctomycetota bacterium]
MPRPLTLFTGQWADLPLAEVCEKAAGFGYEGLELACWGDHFDVRRGAEDDAYCRAQWDTLSAAGLHCYAISNHLAGQAVCDPIDSRHQRIVPQHVWGDGDPAGVRVRASEEMIATARAARRFFDLAPADLQQQLAAQKRCVVNGFTGSPVWHLLYAFPPLGEGQLDAGFAEFASCWLPILDEFQKSNVHFALEVHPTEIAFDLPSTQRALAAVGNHPNFGFNFDPSHFGYQGVDYLRFLREFGDRVWHVHIKDSWWSTQPTAAGVFGGHTEFGADGRYWDFRSPGRGRIDFEEILRVLNHIDYQGPLSVEWEDPQMDREHGAREAVDFVRGLQFPTTARAFDDSFAE